MLKKMRPYIIIAVVAFITGVCLAECRGSARYHKLEDTLLSAADTQTRLRATINNSEIRVAELKRQFELDIERERERVRKQIAIIESIGKGLDGSQGALREFGETTTEGLEIIEKIEKRNAAQ